MIELLTGIGVGAALTFAAQKLSTGHGPLATRMEKMEMAVDQAFADLATQIEALPAQLTAGVQAELAAAQAEVATLQQNAADNLAAVQKAVTDVMPPAAS